MLVPAATLQLVYQLPAEPERSWYPPPSPALPKILSAGTTAPLLRDVPWVVGQAAAHCVPALWQTPKGSRGVLGPPRHGSGHLLSSGEFISSGAGGRANPLPCSRGNETAAINDGRPHAAPSLWPSFGGLIHARHQKLQQPFGLGFLGGIF